MSDVCAECHKLHKSLVKCILPIPSIAKDVCVKLQMEADAEKYVMNWCNKETQHRDYSPANKKTFFCRLYNG